MQAKLLLAVVVGCALLVGGGARARTITVVNNCDFTIYPQASDVGDWQADSGSSKDISVPDNWAGATLFATTGDGVEVPHSLGEFTLGDQYGNDNYDVSFVDGFNLPMVIEPSEDCPTSGCSYDLIPDCPSWAQVKNSAGEVSACRNDQCSNYDYFYDACPNDYVCAGDRQTKTCPSASQSDYTVTFC